MTAIAITALICATITINAMILLRYRRNEKELDKLSTDIINLKISNKELIEITDHLTRQIQNIIKSQSF